MKFINWLISDKQRSSSAADPALDNSQTSEVDDAVDPFNPFPDPVTIEISDVIDLHTIPASDVKRVVVEYLHQAHEAKFRTVRIIHGKGIGVQREIVRSVLAGSDFVVDWTDAPPDAGGLGATIVRLSDVR